MMSLLKEVILLFLISSTIISCVKKNEIIDRPATFYPYYFAIKKPSADDLIMLKQYYEKYDEPFRNEVAILIGAYYLKIGKYENAKFYIEKNANKSGIAQLIKIMGNCWLFDVYLKEKNISKIKESYNNIIKYKNTIDYENAIRGYCSSTGGFFKDIDNNCFTGRYKALLSAEKLDNFNSQYEKKDQAGKQLTAEVENHLKKDKYNIFINGVSINDKFSIGAMFAIYKNKLNYEIYTQESDKISYDYIIDRVGSEYLLKTDKNKIDFSWDYDRLFEQFYSDNINNLKNKTIITIKDGFENKAETLKKEILDRNPRMKVHIIKYSENGFRDDLEYIKKLYGEDISFIGIGVERDMIDFMPMLRFIFSFHIKANLFIDCFSGLYFDKYYSDYFDNSIIFCYVNFLDDFYQKAIIRELESFYGEKVVGETLIGYDMLKYISNYEFPHYDKFLSKIISVDKKRLKVLREPLTLYIKRNKIYSGV